MRTAADALLILQRSVGLRGGLLCRPTEGFCADLNGNGPTDVSDALLVLQSSVGLTDFKLDDLEFWAETVELNPNANAADRTPEYTVSYERWRQAVKAMRRQCALNEEQSADLLARYDAAFFRDHAPIFGVDPVPSAASITADRVSSAFGLPCTTVRRHRERPDGIWCWSPFPSRNCDRPAVFPRWISQALPPTATAPYPVPMVE